MNTGENEQGLRKIIDFTRLLSIAILITHYYLYCHEVFEQLDLTARITDRIIGNFSRMRIFATGFASRITALILLIISLVGAKGKKDEKIGKKLIAIYIFSGFAFFFVSPASFHVNISGLKQALLYIGLSSLGYLLILTGGTLLSRLLKLSLSNDVFNRENETFPQEERLLENEFSINLPASYHYKGKVRKSWINIINPFRGTLVTPGWL